MPLMYIKRIIDPDKLKERFALIYKVLINKYWVDEIYNAIIIKPLLLISEYILTKFIDLGIIDGIVNGFGGVATRSSSSLSLKRLL